ncbi:MAG: hypothetical protein ABI830_10740 [Pseudolabrys sp.]
MNIRLLSLVALAMLSPALAAAQAPPVQQIPLAPKTEQLDPKACAQNGNDTHATVGQGGGMDMQKPASRSLSDQLARSDGVICPPAHVDPEIKAPTPPGGAMPVIPPPGSPGGDQNIRPK